MNIGAHIGRDSELELPRLVQVILHCTPFFNMSLSHFVHYMTYHDFHSYERFINANANYSLLIAQI